MPKLSIQVSDKMKQKLKTYVNTYEEPDIDESGKIIIKVKSGSKP